MICDPKGKKFLRVRKAIIEDNNSIISIKRCIIIFAFILFEMLSNILWQTVVGPANVFYRYLCKAALLIDMILLFGYCCKLIHARWILYIDSIEIGNEQSSNLISVMFCIVMPFIRSLIDRIKSSRVYIYLFAKVNENDLGKNRLISEERKKLYKGYLPSMDLNLSQSSFSSLRNSSAYVRNISTPSRSYINLPHLTNVSPIGRAVMTGMMPEMDTSSPILSSNLSAVNCQVEMPFSPRNTYGYDGGNLCQNNSRIREITADFFWYKLGVDPANVDEWVDNLKQWIHTTILKRVVDEIKNVNGKLQSLGLQDVKVGQSSIQTLRMLSTQSNTPSTLSLLINFLDCCRDQAYIVTRLQELSQGLSLSRYTWNGGSSHPKYTWKEHLPNDATLILHLFTTYIDSKHPSSQHPTAPTCCFNQQFIVDSPHLQDSVSNKDSCLLQQLVVQPPHFRIIMDNTIVNVAQGRNNLFECLIIFLYKVNRNETNFKWLNLGRAGLNLNWIFNH